MSTEYCIEIPADLRPHLVAAARDEIASVADTLIHVADPLVDPAERWPLMAARMEEALTVWRDVINDETSRVCAPSVRDAARVAGDIESERLSDNLEGDDAEILESARLIQALAVLRRDAACVALGIDLKAAAA
jgi:hypothetical protein